MVLREDSFRRLILRFYIRLEMDGSLHARTFKTWNEALEFNNLDLLSRFICVSSMISHSISKVTLRVHSRIWNILALSAGKIN